VLLLPTLVALALTAALYVYLNIKLVQFSVWAFDWIKHSTAFHIQEFIWRVEKSLLEQSSAAANALGAILLAVFFWLVFKLQSAFDLVEIIW
jgi:hypothetical protein